MSLLWQIRPNYGLSDSVWLYRDADLMLSLLGRHPEMSVFHDRSLALLAKNSKNWVSLRNKLLWAHSGMANFDIPDEDIKNLQWVDNIHFDYLDLLAFRNALLQNPTVWLSLLKAEVEGILGSYPMRSEDIISIGDNVSKVNAGNFGEILEKIPSHVQQIAFLEWCIGEGQCLEHVILHAKYQRETRFDQRNDSMEYWNYNNIVVLADTRKRLLLWEKWANTKAFSLSGWSGNAFTQLAIMQKFVENWGKISSISATSAGSALGVLVAKIWHDASKLRELMNDFEEGNRTWAMPRSLIWNEKKVKEFYDGIALKYGVDYTTKFSDLQIPIVVNAWRQYKWWEQEIVLWWEEKVMDAIWASQNVPDPKKPWSNKNIGALWVTEIQGISMIDYAANERGNPTHWLELLWEEQKHIVAIDAWYSSEKGGSPSVRRLFQRANRRDFLAKLRIRKSGWLVIDVPLNSTEGYDFFDWALRSEEHTSELQSR